MNCIYCHNPCVGDHLHDTFECARHGNISIHYKIYLYNNRYSIYEMALFLSNDTYILIAVEEAVHQPIDIYLMINKNSYIPFPLMWVDPIIAEDLLKRADNFLLFS